MPTQASDLLEQVTNRRHKQAVQLLVKILDDLPYDGFTEDDVRDSFNALACGAGFVHGQNTTLVRYGRSHLNYLVDKQVLEVTGDLYVLNLGHPVIVRELGVDVRSFEEEE